MAEVKITYKSRKRAKGFGWVDWELVWSFGPGDWKQYEFKVNGVQQESYEELYKFIEGLRAWKELQQ